MTIEEQDIKDIHRSVEKFKDLVTKPSSEYSSNGLSDVLHSLLTIEERAKNIMSDEYSSAMNMGLRNGYIQGATEQQKIDIEKVCEYIRSSLGLEIGEDEYCQWEQDFRNAMEE